MDPHHVQDLRPCFKAPPAPNTRWEGAPALGRGAWGGTRCDSDPCWWVWGPARGQSPSATSALSRDEVPVPCREVMCWNRVPPGPRVVGDSQVTGRRGHRRTSL